MKHLTAIALTALLSLPTVAVAADDLDFNKPLFLRAGRALCTSAEELDLYIQGTPARCRRMTADTPMAYVASSGWLSLRIRVRATGTRQITDGWTMPDWLRN